MRCFLRTEAHELDLVLHSGSFSKCGNLTHAGQPIQKITSSVGKKVYLAPTHQQTHSELKWLLFAATCLKPFKETSSSSISSVTIKLLTSPRRAYKLEAPRLHTRLSAETWAHKIIRMWNKYMKNRESLKHTRGWCRLDHLYLQNAWWT